MNIYNSLIGFWRLNTGSGITAIDSSGYGNDGTLEGTAPTWVDGRSGKAVNFPGTNERVDCGNGSPLDDIGNGDFSLSFWMKSKDTVPLGYGRLFSKTDGGTNWIRLMSSDTNNRMYFDMKKGAILVGGALSTSSTAFDTNWNHIVMIVNRTTNKALLYMNNVKDITELDISSLPIDCSNIANLSWGADHGGSRPYEGLIDEVRIYNRALTKEEIEFLYIHPAGLSGPIGFWKLDEVSGINAPDESQFGNDGTLEGTAPTWVDGISKNAVNFPGTNERIDCGNDAPLNSIGHGSFSISFWMKSKDTVPLDFGRLFNKQVDAATRILLCSYLTDNRLYFVMEVANVGISDGFSVDSNPFDTNWNHIVLNIDRTIDKAILYINTVKDTTELSTSSCLANCSNTGNLSWGAIDNGTGSYEGIIDECRIYDYVLTEAQIESLYRNPGGLPEIQKGIQVKIYSSSNELVAILSDTDLSGDILKVNLTDLKIGGVDNFTFTLDKNTDKPISENSECYFYIDGALWFIGYIAEVPEPDQDRPILEFKGKGFVNRLKRKVINTSYSAQTLSAIIANLGTNYLGSDLGVSYDAAKINVPVISSITIEFKDKNLFDIFNELLKIANNNYTNNKYRFYVDNEKELVFKEISATISEYLFEGFNYQEPEVSLDNSRLINKLFAFRTVSGSPKIVEYVATYQDTESQGRYGVFDKKITFPEYADSITIQNMSNSILKRRKSPQKRINIKNYGIDSVLPFGFYSLSNKRKEYWNVLAECDTLTGWSTGNLPNTTMSVSTSKVLTGRRALKFITTGSSNGDYTEFTLENILPFPIDFRFFVYFVGTVIPIQIIIVDENDAETSYSVKQITNEWIMHTENIFQVTDSGLMKVNYSAVLEGNLIVNYGVATEGNLSVRHLVSVGPKSIKKIKILIQSNTITTFYIDRIEAYADIYKNSKLLLEEVKYSLSSKALFVDAFFGDKSDNVMDEIKGKTESGEIALQIVSKQ